MIKGSSIMGGSFYFIMSTKKRRFRTSGAEAFRREQEIKEHGKLVSLRPSIPHKSKKLYSRKPKRPLDFGDL